MAGSSVEVKIREDVISGLRGMAARGRNIRPVLSAFGQIAVDSVEGNFAAGGRPTRWVPLKRPRKGGKILTLSSRLRHSVHYRVSGTNEVRCGTNLIYAGVHNDGFTDSSQRVRAHTRRITQAFGRRISPVEVQVSAFARRMSIPQREFLIIHDEDQREMERTAADWISKGKAGP